MAKYIACVLPLLILLMIAPVSAQLDLAISDYFFKDGSFVSNWYVRLLYSYGEYFGLLVAFCCGWMLVYTFLTKRYTYLARALLTAVLTFVIGAGLITNILLKGFWGRARPRQIEHFGGSKPFSPFYKPNLTVSFGEDQQKSFPSGHAAVGFFFFVFAVIGWKERNRWLMWLGVVSGLILGINLSLIRIMQGGHFFTDTLASAAIMCWVALTVAYLVYDRALLDEWL